MSRKYVKKPIAIEAFRFGYDSVPDWFEYKVKRPDGSTVVKTLEGTMICRRGDWIIKGVRGECYPCAHDIFLETYEEVA